MRRPRSAGMALTASLIAAVALCAAGGTAVAVPPATPTAGPERAASTSFNVPGILVSVTAAGPDNVWAVGCGGTCSSFPAYRTLIVHWNGRTWSQVTNPKPVGGVLYSVFAAGPDNVWAVGATINAFAEFKTLIMHWNGKAWSRQPAGVPVLAGALTSVAASGSRVWVAGETGAPLVLQRTAGRWYVVPISRPGDVYGGTIAAAGNAAWVAFDGGKNLDTAALWRWTGSLWKPAAFPLRGPDNDIDWMAAGPAGDIWAVGYHDGATHSPLSMLWNGKTWRKVPVPAPPDSALNGAGFVPGGTAWAVGWAGATVAKTLILRWTGHAWARVNSPTPTGSASLFSVAATSSANAWAVGDGHANKPPYVTVILHWNGKTWS